MGYERAALRMQMLRAERSKKAYASIDRVESCADRALVWVLIGDLVCSAGDGKVGRGQSVLMDVMDVVNVTR